MSGDKRRVLFIIPTLTGGGAERVVVTLLQHLDRTRFDLTLAVVDMRDAAFADQVPQDVRFIDLGCTRVLHALPRLVRLLWQMRPDTVLSTLGHLNLALAMLRPLLPGGTRYQARETTVLSLSMPEYRRPALWTWAYRRFYHRFDRVVCQSAAMRDDLVAHFNVPLERTTVIHNPLDFERIDAQAKLPPAHQPSGAWQDGSSQTPVRLVTAARLVAQKGVDVTIEALAAARRRDMVLTVLGDGPERGRLEELVHSLGLDDRVRFVGFQSNPWAFFARADAFVLSSGYEGFPNAVLEALACGTPVIALPCPGGLREIVEPIDGCVLAGDMTARGLAAALDQWRPCRVERRHLEPYRLSRVVGAYAMALDR